MIIYSNGPNHITRIVLISIIILFFVGLQPLQCTAQESGDACNGLGLLISAKDAVISSGGVIGTPGNLLSTSGSFKEHPENPLCEPPVIHGPFEVPSGGKLDASIVGNPAVPYKWITNTNTVMKIFYEPKYGQDYGPGTEILTLAGQAEDNNLKGSAEWPGPGRITIAIIAPRGAGALFGQCFSQSYSAKVDIVSLNNKNPANGGTILKPGDNIKTGSSGEVTAILNSNGGKLFLGPNSDVDFQKSTEGGIAGSIPPLENPAADEMTKLKMKLQEFWDQGLPMPSEWHKDRSGFLDNFRQDLFSNTITGAAAIIDRERDPCEAAIELKLFFDSHRGEITTGKIGETCYTLVKTLGVSLFLAKTGLAAIPAFLGGAPINQALDSGLIKLGKDAYREYVVWIAANEAKVGLETFRNSRGWTKEQMDDRLSKLKTEIEDDNRKICEIKESALKKQNEDYLKLINQYGNQFNIPETDQMIYSDSIDKRNQEASGQIAKLVHEVAELSIQEAVIERFRKPIVMGTFDQLKAPKIPILQSCPESARLQLYEGILRWSKDKTSDEKGLKIEIGSYTVTPKGTEVLCEKRGDTSRVAVIDGNATISNATTSEIELHAGQQIDLVTGAISPYNVSTDDGGLVGGIPLRDLPLDDTIGQPYGLYIPFFSNNTTPTGWIWQDPGNDAKVETPEFGTLKVTVPDSNEFWDARTQAPRLLHKVTGDFELEGELLLKSNGTDHAISEFIMYSPGSYLGYLTKQMNPDGLGAHYRILGGGWVRIQGMNKLTSLNRELRDSPNAPDIPVKLKMTRHGDIWKTYWSLDGQNWNLSTRREFNASSTVWVGWLFKRNAYDGLYSEPAISTLKDVRLTTEPLDSKEIPKWDLVQWAGTADANDTLISLSLNGTTLGDVAAETGERFSGDLDAVVHFDTSNWTGQDGVRRELSLFATNGDDKNYAYIGICQSGTEPQRYQTDLGINKGWGRYNWIKTSDLHGYLRIVRHNGNFSTYYWSECQWVKLADFKTGFTDPVYMGVSIANSYQANKPVPLAVDFNVEQIQAGEAISGNWTPTYCSLIQPVPLPTGITLPQGVEAMMFNSTFPIGTIFFGPDGIAYAFSNERGKQKLMAIDSIGTARTYTESEILAGINLKAGLISGSNILMTVDFWPDSGNSYRGIFELNSNGSFRQWNLTSSHDGLSDIISAPKGGWYFSDFENDNIWLLLAEDTVETPLITKGDIPLGLGALAYDGLDDILYALNWVGDWPFGGTFAVYEITKDGEAALFAKINETSKMNGGMALSSSGPFGHALYVSDAAAGKVLKVEGETTKPVITGLIKPGQMQFNPVTGDLLIVCDDGKSLMWIGSDLSKVGTGRPSAMEVPYEIK